MSPEQDAPASAGVTTTNDNENYIERINRDMAWRRKMGQKNGIKKAEKMNRKARRKANCARL